MPATRFTPPTRPTRPARCAPSAPSFARSASAALTALAAVGWTVACSATPEQRLAQRLRGTRWEGGLSDPATLYANKGHDGEFVEFRGDSTVVFTRVGTSVEATYSVADSAHIRVRPSGPAGLFMGERTFLVNTTNGDTLRLLPTPFPASAAAYGEWLRRDRR